MLISAIFSTCSTISICLLLGTVRDDGVTLAFNVMTCVMSVLSLIGSSTIISLYLYLPRLRTDSRRLLIYLSICDFMVACGNIMGVIMWVYKADNSSFSSSVRLCTVYIDDWRFSERAQLQNFTTNLLLFPLVMWLNADQMYGLSLPAKNCVAQGIWDEFI